MSSLKSRDPQVAKFIASEVVRQETGLEMIASENYVSEAVLEAQGSILTNKYAEGLPRRRYYGGCEFVDQAEDLARKRARELFGCDRVNVQPHSGAQANMAAFMAVLSPGDRILGMNPPTVVTSPRQPGELRKYTGPHTGSMKKAVPRLRRHRQAAIAHQPKLLPVCRPILYDFERFRNEDEVGALMGGHRTLLDRYARLHPDPFPSPPRHNHHAHPLRTLRRDGDVHRRSWEGGEPQRLPPQVVRSCTSPPRQLLGRSHPSSRNTVSRCSQRKLPRP